MATEFQDWDLSRLAYEYRAAGHSMSAAMASLSSRITAELERRDDCRRRLEASHARLVDALRSVLPYARTRVKAIQDQMVGNLYPAIMDAELQRADAALTEAQAIAKETT